MSAEVLPEDEARRLLSRGLERVAWPPRVGARVHYNSGWRQTSWSGEVRAVVDDEIAVVREWWNVKKRWHWRVLDRVEVDVFDVRYGSLPSVVARMRIG